MDELIKDKIEAIKESKAKENEEQDIVKQQVFIPSLHSLLVLSPSILLLIFTITYVSLLVEYVRSTTPSCTTCSTGYGWNGDAATHGRNGDAANATNATSIRDAANGFVLIDNGGYAGVIWFLFWFWRDWIQSNVVSCSSVWTCFDCNILLGRQTEAFFAAKYEYNGDW